jgi:hypothetical protein
MPWKLAIQPIGVRGLGRRRLRLLAGVTPLDSREQRIRRPATSREERRELPP